MLKQLSLMALMASLCLGNVGHASTKKTKVFEGEVVDFKTAQTGDVFIDKNARTYTIVQQGERSVFGKAVKTFEPEIIEKPKFIELPDNLQHNDKVKILVKPSYLKGFKEVHPCQVVKFDADFKVGSLQEFENCYTIKAYYWGTTPTYEPEGFQFKGCQFGGIPEFVFAKYKNLSKKDVLPELEGCRLLSAPYGSVICPVNCDITFEECCHNTIATLIKGETETECKIEYKTVDTSDNNKVVKLDTYCWGEDEIVVLKEMKGISPLNPQFDLDKIIFLNHKNKNHSNNEKDELDN